MGEIDRIPQIQSVPILTQRAGDQGRQRQEDPKARRQDVVEIGEEMIDEVQPEADADPVEAPYRLDIAA